MLSSISFVKKPSQLLNANVVGRAKSRAGWLRTKRSKALTHGCVVGVGEALVHPLPHELPFVVGKITLDDLVVVLSQLFGGLEVVVVGDWGEDT